MELSIYSVMWSDTQDGSFKVNGEQYFNRKEALEMYEGLLSSYLN